MRSIYRMCVFSFFVAFFAVWVTGGVLRAGHPSFCLRARLLKLCSGTDCICLYDCIVCTTDENGDCNSQNTSFTTACDQPYNQDANCCGLGGFGICWTEASIEGSPTAFERVATSLAAQGVTLDSISVDEGIGVEPPRTINVKFKLKDSDGHIGDDWFFARIFLCNSPLPSGQECRIGVEVSEEYAGGAVDCGALDFREDKLRRVTFQDGEANKSSIVILAED